MVFWLCNFSLMEMIFLVVFNGNGYICDNFMNVDCWKGMVRVVVPFE